MKHSFLPPTALFYKYVLAMLLTTSLAACSSNGSTNDPASDSETGGSEVTAMVGELSGNNDDDPVVPPSGQLAAITEDNHEALLRYIFSIYSAQTYGQELVQLSGYPDSRYYTIPTTVEPGVENVTCENGGTATFTLSFVSPPAPLRWIHEFDNCQVGSDVFNGRVSRDTGNVNITNQNEVAYATGPAGLSRESMIDKRTVIGQVAYRAGSGDYYVMTRLKQFLVEGAGVDKILLQDGTSQVFAADSWITFLDGGFTITSTETGQNEIVVAVTKAFGDESSGSIPPNTRFPFGIMTLTARDGSRLTLNANNGNLETVSISIVNSNGTVTLEKPWSLWDSALTFNSFSISP